MLRVPVLGFLLGLVLWAMPAAAQDDGAADAAQWQAAITGQVEAFRKGDAPGALSFAGAEFKQGFADPRAFVMAIISWGYEPIVTSRSHSFGPYKMTTPDEVMQDVKFVGADQLLYEAIYQLEHEPDGWRIHGVQMVKTKGVGV
jgi:hypothetical protein